MIEDSAAQELKVVAQSFAGKCAALISYLIWASLVVFAYRVKQQGTTGSGYAEYQTRESLDAEHWLLWASAAWFLLGSFFLWASQAKLKAALSMLHLVVFFIIAIGFLVCTSILVPAPR